MIGIEAFARDSDPLSARLVLGLAVGFAGILLLVWPDIALGGAEGRHFLAGVIALQIACVGWALGSSLSRRHARQENVMSAAAMQMLFGGLMMLAWAMRHPDKPRAFVGIYPVCNLAQWPMKGKELTLADYAQTAYLEYALSVMKGRALPDVCDGQKPVQRRILYAMSRMGLGFGGIYNKLTLGDGGC